MRNPLIRCPSCRFTEGDIEPGEDGFEMIWSTRSLYSGPTRSLPDGSLAHPDDHFAEIGFGRNRRPMLRCPSCGHVWTTSKKVEP